MPFIQLPGDSTGKLIETVTPALSSAGSTMHREVMAVGDYASTAIALVTSSGGLAVNVTNPSTSVTITNPSTSVTVTNISTAVTVTNPSTAINIVGTSGAIAPATSSGGLSVTIVSGAGAGSTAVNITGLSTAIATVTSSAGLMVTISSGLVTNVSASSGLVQISGFVVSMKTTNATAAAQTTVTTSGDLLLAANAARHRAMVQNSGIIPVRLSLSTVMPTATAYHVSLSAGSVADNGNGAMYIDEMWRGGISAITSASGGTVVVTELTT